MSRSAGCPEPAAAPDSCVSWPIAGNTLGEIAQIPAQQLLSKDTGETVEKNVADCGHGAGHGNHGRCSGALTAARGHRVKVRNRRQARADPLRTKGGAVATSPSVAVADAEIVLTVLFDTDAVIEVMTATLGSLPTSSIWGS